MPLYVRRFDVCLVPFIADEVTASMDLVKVYEYLAQGKPVVCTPVAEMVQYERDLYLADGPDEFVDAVNRALTEDDQDAVERRIRLARMNSWDDRIDVLEQIAADALTGLSALVERDVPLVIAGASDELATTKAKLAATQAKLDALNRTKAVRGMRRYWRLRDSVGGKRR
jgi:hypothetical protein